MADAKAAQDVTQSYTTLQGGDLFGVERGGVFGKFTWSNFQAQSMTLTGTIDMTGATVTPYAGSFTTLSASDVLSVASDIQHVGDTDNKIAFATDTQDFQTGGSSRLDISDSGVRLGGANARVTSILDEDDLTSDSAAALATQQSIKAYTDAQVAALGSPFSEVARNVLSSDGTTVTVTGLSGQGYELVRGYCLGQSVSSSTITSFIIEARTAAGTWRSLATLTGTAGVLDVFMLEFEISNWARGDGTDLRLVTAEKRTEATGLDVSTAGETEISDGTPDTVWAYSVRAEDWDELRVRSTNANMEGDTASQAARLIVFAV